MDPTSPPPVVLPVAAQPAPQPPSVQHPKRSFVLPALLVLLILLLGSTAFLGYQNMQLTKQLTALKTVLSPTPTQAPESIVNWKTYTSEKFGFSVSYPPDAKTTTRDPDPFPVAIQIDNLKACTGKACGGWLIIVSETQPNGHNEPLRQWAKENRLISDALIQQGSETAATDTQIGGEPTIYWTTSGGDAQLAYYLLQRTDGVTLIIVNPSSKNDTITQILSTFTFLDTQNAASNWKTFTDADYAISYPPEWTIERILGEGGYATSISNNQTGNREISGSLGIGGSFGVIETFTPTKKQIGKYIWEIRQNNQGGYMDHNGNQFDTSDRLYTTIGNDGKTKFSFSVTMPRNSPAEIPEITQILSTFTFITPPTTPPAMHYTCPANGWANCMPGNVCSPEAMAWYQINCLNFKGGAL